MEEEKQDVKPDRVSGDFTSPKVPDALEKRVWRRYAAELLIVFAGVLAAFLISDWRQQQIEEERRGDQLFLVYEDFSRFCAAGDTANPEGFIHFFEEVEADIEKMISERAVYVGYAVVGDYWNIEVISALLQSGQLNSLESHLFLNVSRFHSVHGNFLASIARLNRYYEEHLLPLAGRPLDMKNPVVSSKVELFTMYGSSISNSARITLQAAVAAKAYLEKDPRIKKRLREKRQKG